MTRGYVPWTPRARTLAYVAGVVVILLALLWAPVT